MAETYFFSTKVNAKSAAKFFRIGGCKRVVVKYAKKFKGAKKWHVTATKCGRK